jgi:hypothetical protein
VTRSEVIAPKFRLDSKECCERSGKEGEGARDKFLSRCEGQLSDLHWCQVAPVTAPSTFCRGQSTFDAGMYVLACSNDITPARILRWQPLE